MSAVRTEHDALLLDLDGTVYHGSRAVPGAADVLRDSAETLLYVTNNASKSPSEVARHLQELGFAAEEEAVVTSSQAAASVLAARLEPGATVLVVGTAALVEQVEARGLRVVPDAAAQPDAVVHGHSPDTGWRQLAEATVAIRNGALSVATNVDPTLPSERGLLPGNGSMVGVVRIASGVEPVVAGKPERPIMDDAIARIGCTRPLVVGDRLDTDIQGARTVGARSLLVLTGVSTARDLLNAAPEQRPDLVAPDLAGLDRPSSELTLGEAVDGCDVQVEDGVLVVHGGTDPLAALRAAVHHAWSVEAPGGGWRGVRSDGDVGRALDAWGGSPVS